MHDIARLANVSMPTVSRVLSGSPLVTSDTRDRVLEVARAQGYAVNRNAQKLRNARTSTVAVMLDFGSHRHGAIGDPFIFELLAGVSEALSIRNQDLLLSPPGLDDARAFRDFFHARGADGFIVLGQGTRDAMLRSLESGERAVRGVGRGVAAKRAIARSAATICWAESWRAGISCLIGASAGCSSATSGTRNCASATKDCARQPRAMGTSPSICCRSPPWPSR